MNNKKLVLRVHNFEKVFGSKVLFEKTNLLIHEGDKVAVLGQNGSGKTTFTRCIAEEVDYLGSFEIAEGFSVAIMEQEKIFEKSELTFMEYLELKRDNLNKKKEEIEQKFAEPEIFNDSVLYEKLLSDYAKISSRCETNIDEEKIKTILEEIGFEMKDYGKKIISLSGGQKTKLRLAEVLGRDADFTILDEPTNHLDFDTIRWLEKRLFYTKKTLLVISHDRHFINLVSNRIVEIEDNNFENYNCSYVDFLKKKKERHIALKNKFESTQREKKRLLKSEEEKRKWAHLVGSKKMKIQADNLKRRRENIGEHPNPDDFLENFVLKFKEGNSPGNLIFKAENLSKHFGEIKIFFRVNFKIENGDRVALIGKNGSGKTTLLKIFAQKDKDFEGILKIGENLKIGYLDQEFKDMDPKQKIMDYLWGADPKLMEHHIIANLIKFGFDFSRIDDEIKKLSGGEKTRLSLVKLMLSKCNVLLLDEPTNNLDIELIGSLEDALKLYSGTIIVVSHDRRFINKIATKLFVFGNNNIQILKGNFKDNFS